MLDAIFSRRSVREGFEDGEISHEVLEQIVSAGLAAPSSKAAQPWRMHVVTSRRTLAELGDAVASAPGADTYAPIDPATGENRPDWPSTVDISADALRTVPAAIFIENLGRFSAGRHNIAIQPDPAVREDALVGYSFEMIGHGIAIANMWLAAISLELAGCFMGDVLVAEQAIRQRLGFVGDLVGVFGFGYPSEAAPPPHPRFLEADTVVWHS
jgi:nitroreductase